jgi:hypothetical protein
LTDYAYQQDFAEITPTTILDGTGVTVTTVTPAPSLALVVATPAPLSPTEQSDLDEYMINEGYTPTPAVLGTGILVTANAKNAATIPVLQGAITPLAVTPAVSVQAGQKIIIASRVFFQTTGGLPNLGEVFVAVQYPPGPFNPAGVVDAYGQFLTASLDATMSSAGIELLCPADIPAGSYSFQLQANVTLPIPSGQLEVRVPPANFVAGAQLLVSVVNV